MARKENFCELLQTRPVDLGAKSPRRSPKMAHQGSRGALQALSLSNPASPARSREQALSGGLPSTYYPTTEVTRGTSIHSHSVDPTAAALAPNTAKPGTTRDTSFRGNSDGTAFCRPDALRLDSSAYQPGPAGVSGGETLAAGPLSDQDVPESSHIQAGGQGETDEVSGADSGHSASEASKPFPDKAAAFEAFRRTSSKVAAYEENRTILREKIIEAKALAEQVHQRKAAILHLKSTIQKRSMMQAAASLVEGSDVSHDPEGEAAKLQADAERAAYKAAFAQVRDLKSEIECIQRLLEQSRRDITNSFEQWYSKQEQHL
eukprot:jgi/Botrbrau1/11771/Bobra.0195s0096.1